MAANRQMQQVRKVAGYIADGLTYLAPSALQRRADARFLASLTDSEMEQASRRAHYLCRFAPCTPAHDWTRVADFRFPITARQHHSGYFFPLHRALQSVSPHCRFSHLFGDITYEPHCPAFVKSRPITASPTDLTNSVVMKLNAVRHFRFISDPVPWKDTQPRLVSRNFVYWPKRVDLLKRWFGHPDFDLGQINPEPDHGHPEWLQPRMSLRQQLDYRFIACVEGNDVATNLKWVMSSNSLAVSPEPQFESWFMEGRLIPGVHYVRCRPDYSDLHEQMDHYLSHPDQAEEIIRNAHLWVDTFRSPRLERATQLLVVRRYMHLTGQL